MVCEKSKKVESNIFRNTSSGRETSRFTAKELDSETALYYFGARYMDPRTSRWISSDPSGFQLINPMDEEGKPRSGYSVIEATNWYSYVSNNSVKYVDPNGMWKVKFGLALLGVAVQIEFGNNEGIKNFDWKVGAGIGAVFAWNPAEQDPGDVGMNVTLEGNIDVGLIQGGSLDADIDVEMKGGEVEINSESTLSIPIPNSGNANVDLSLSSEEGFTNETSVDSEVTVGAMMMVGFGMETRVYEDD